MTEILFVVINLVKPGNNKNPKKWKWVARPEDENPTMFYKGFTNIEDAKKEAKGKYEVKELICDQL